MKLSGWRTPVCDTYLVSRLAELWKGRRWCGAWTVLHRAECSPPFGSNWTNCATQAKYFHPTVRPTRVGPSASTLTPFKPYCVYEVDRLMMLLDRGSENHWTRWFLTLWMQLSYMSFFEFNGFEATTLSPITGWSWRCESFLIITIRLHKRSGSVPYRLHACCRRVESLSSAAFGGNILTVERWQEIALN